MGNHQRHHDEHPSANEDPNEDEDAATPLLQPLARSAVYVRLEFEDLGVSALRLEREL